MIPYGIVFKDNLYALEQSCLIWQKKYGVLRASSLIKTTAIITVLIFLINGALYFLNKEEIGFLLYTSVLMSVIFAFLVYFTFKTTYVKQLAKGNMTLYQKQAVIFEDRVEFTSPYSRSVFYFSEILSCEEKAGILTIIPDKGMLPISIYSSCVGKGNYDEFTRILKEKIGTGRYIGKDGNV